MKARTFKDYILTRSKNRGHLRGQITLPLAFFSLRHAPLAVHHDCIKKWRYGSSGRKMYNFTGAANKGRGVGEVADFKILAYCRFPTQLIARSLNY